MTDLLQTAGKSVVLNDAPVRLCGVNLGGWLNIEDFMLGLPGVGWEIQTLFRRILGAETAQAFFDCFERNFITEADIREIKRLGFNFVRLPFNYRSFEVARKPGAYNEAGFARIDELFEWCRRHDLFVLLDMHAAPGGQNTTSPADNSTGFAGLWTGAHEQDRAIGLWEEMARRYGCETGLMGYNLLNEPITDQFNTLDGPAQTAAMNDFYRRLIPAIRAIDPAHCIVLEGNVRQSGGIRTLDPALFAWPNLIASFHYYPLFQIADVPGLGLGEDKAAGLGASTAISRQVFADTMRQERDYAQEVQAPMLLGEFGFFANKDPVLQGALMDLQLSLAEEWGWSWCLWTWKDLHLMGLVQPRPDTPWRTFVERTDLNAVRARCHDEWNRFFDRVFNPSYGRSAPFNDLFDYAYNATLRGQRLLELQWLLQELGRQHSPAEIIRMPDAFRLDQCKPTADWISLVQRHMQ